MCVGRGESCDPMSRGHVLHVRARVDFGDRTLQLFVSYSRHACTTIPGVWDARRQRLLDMKDMASGTEPSEQGLTSSIGERCPHPQIHFLQSGRRP